MTRLLSFLMAGAVALLAAASAQADAQDWSVDVGVRWFKLSSEGGPNELSFNPVFDRWEAIERDRSTYSVSGYTALKPLYFNMSFGADLMVRFKKYLLLRLSYDYTDPLGIGGWGRIAYDETSTGDHVVEKKSFSYTSHQM
jgi:hypothetical protein